ncbi:AGAP007171-PA [Anopheles gambiae str. PEST]|uniref:AGAP007171-PA n=1 Tax=Anopheles gambiae TaxID=7165 RepID=A0NBC4_ANOGA|nr:AGAP007171-PA [Anopheles gambiae str. PEST]
MASNDSTQKPSSERIPNIDDTVSKFYNGLCTLQQQSKNLQKRDIEQLLKAALGCADSIQKYTPSSDTSSFLHSDDSNDSSQLLIASGSDHSEQLESSGETFTSTTSTLNDSRPVPTMKKLHPSRPLSRWHALVAVNNEEIPIAYHKSMARQFPVKDRTPEQMEARRRNNDASRVSRAKSKMAEQMMEKEASELDTANTSIKEMIASQLAYANELCKLLDMPSVQLSTFKRMGVSSS